MFISCLQSDVILVMTCSIREGAEDKIWKRLKYLKSLKQLRKQKQPSAPPVKIGILGISCPYFKTKQRVAFLKDAWLSD